MHTRDYKELRHKLGQNTAEYLIMLVLVAVGSIGIFSIFGDTLKKQVHNVIAAVGGERDKITAVTNADEAQRIIDRGVDMDITNEDVLTVPNNEN